MEPPPPFWVNESRGNLTNPTHYIHIHYCGQWCYKKFVTNIIEALNKEGHIYAGIQYKLMRDNCYTGNFECNGYTKKDLSDKPTLLWSK